MSLSESSCRNGRLAPRVKRARYISLLPIFSILLLPLSSVSHRVVAAPPAGVGFDDVTTLSLGQRATRQIKGGERSCFKSLLE